MFYPRIVGLPTFRSFRPFEELNRMRRQMDRVMDFFERPAAGLGAGVFPSINLTEDDDYFYVRAELPGVQTADLEIQATANNLTISGERRPQVEDASAKYHRREREHGKFSRAFSLPKEIDSERVEARLVNGMLTVKVPKAEAAKPRRIPIGS